jgi:RNA polymerase sigma-70 factor (ECF subfamily)
LRRLGVAESDIDDLIQDAYCRLATLTSVDHIDRPGAYFMQIVKNAWRDGLRRARVVRFEDFTENTTPFVEDDTTGIEATAIRWTGCRWATVPTTITTGSASAAR